jgi:hypothetical protein
LRATNQRGKTQQHYNINTTFTAAPRGRFSQNLGSRHSAEPTDKQPLACSVMMMMMMMMMTTTTTTT